MKTMKYIATGIVTLFFLAGMMNSYAGSVTKSETLKMKVEIMCQNCVNKIQTGLGKTPGVEKAVADLATKTVTITYDPAKTNKDKLVKACEDLGYKTEFSAAGVKGHECKDDKGAKGAGCSKTCTGDKK